MKLHANTYHAAYAAVAINASTNINTFFAGIVPPLVFHSSLCHTQNRSYIYHGCTRSFRRRAAPSKELPVLFLDLLFPPFLCQTPFMIFTHIVGTRPNFIKMEPVYRALHAEGHEQIVLNTGQHFSPSMIQDLTRISDSPAGYLPLGGMIDWLCARWPSQVPRIQGITIVYGDTNSSLAGAIAASQCRLPIAHVEAGLRCGDLTMIEEVNRTLIDSISTWNFLPSRTQAANVPSQTAYVVGDVMYDLWKSAPPKIEDRDYVLLTLHRAEHTDSEPKLLGLLERLRRHFHQKIVFPVHPRTAKCLARANGLLAQFSVLDPVPHATCQELIAKASAVVTDSGGVSKEAAWAHKPLYILRSVSEWGLPTVGHWAEHLDRPMRLISTLESGDGAAAKRIATILSAPRP